VKRHAGGVPAQTRVRLEKTSFLTPDEKRAAIGFDPASIPPLDPERKYSPDQLRDDNVRSSS
jgi:hypothetical protein